MTEFDELAHPRDPTAPNRGWFGSVPHPDSPHRVSLEDFDAIPHVYTGLVERDQPRQRLRNGECWVDGFQFPDHEFDEGVKIAQRTENLLTAESTSILADGTVLRHDATGYLHCPCGPAVQRPDGTREFWESGARMDGSSLTADPDRH